MSSSTSSSPRLIAPRGGLVMSFDADSGSNPGKLPRQRRWSPKVKTGCATCRARRVKCDETKPECIRCQRSKKKCTGWIGDYSSATVDEPALAVYQLAQTIAPAGIKMSQQDRMAFETLRIQTAFEVAGCFDHSFWSKDVMQAAQAYPVIWHAGVAMASIHHRIKIAASENSKADEKTLSKQCYVQALDHYNSSIRDLVKMVNRENPTLADQEAILVVCLIFTGLCAMMGNMDDAITHARNGLLMFYQWRYWETAERCRGRSCLVTANSLIVAYTHLESQFIERMDFADRPRWRGRGSAFKCSAAPFGSLTDAYFELQPLLTGLIDEGKDNTVPGKQNPEFGSVLQDYTHQFDIWREKFVHLQSVSTFCGTDLEGLLILKIYANCIALLVEHDFEGSEEAFDAYGAIFEDTISLAEQIYDGRRKSGKLQGYGALQYSFSLSTCQALDFVGHICRDPSLRRRLIALLRKWPHREWMWDSELIASAVEATLTMEESGVEDGAETIGGCTCIPGISICNDHRVCTQAIEFLPGGKVKATMFTVGGSRKGLPGKVVMLR